MRRYADELAGLNTEVLIVSFGTEPQARAWVRETGIPFSLLLDSDRRAYRAYGLARSLARTWTPRVLWYYVRQFTAGRRSRIEGDPHQLGGDFIIDRGGIVRFAHREWDPMDRPPVVRLLAVLRTIEGGTIGPRA